MKATWMVALLVVCLANNVISTDENVTPCSCQDVLAQGGTENGEYEIDPDGPGGELPFRVFCEMSGGKGLTVIHHDTEYENREDRRVDNAEAAGSFKRPVKYNGNMRQILSLLDLSGYCEQFISYEAHASVMFWPPANRLYGWWENRHGRKMLNWGGAPTGVRGCGCSTQAKGCIEKKSCNADCNTHQLTEDSGYLNDKENLPVTRLRFGDTGTLDDDEYGYYKLGPIKCSGGVTRIEQAIPIFVTDEVYHYRYELPEIAPGECRVEFEVQACNDAFIGFSEVQGEQGELVELNLGGWGNTKTVFRNCKQCQIECEVMENVLNCDEARRFWVSWCGGTLSFGREGHGQLMNWTPQRSLNFNYVAYSTGYGSSGKFAFDSFYAKEIHTCQNSIADINCGSKFINIISAVYGRNSKNYCIDQYMRSTTCASSKSLEVVGLQCQGKHSCRISVGNGIFGNPCCGTSKYLHTKYRCEVAAREKRFTNDACENHKCNPLGGQCVPTHAMEYHCSCKPSFFGKYCEREYALCRASGDPHYVKFSGRKYNYQGMCKYVLAQPCVETGEGVFKVVGINKVASWNNRVSYNRGLEVKIGNTDILISKGKQVVVNNDIVNVPCKPAEDVEINNDGKFVVISSEKYGVQVHWDGSDVFKIFADKTLYADNMCGLCGGVKERSNDPFRMKDGTTTNDPNAFGDSWIANPFECNTCKDCVPLSHCKNDADLLRKAKLACEPIRAADGVFAVGHGLYDAEQMFESCVFDLCSKSYIDNEIRCKSMEEYANRILQENRHDYIRDANKIINWRTELDCPFTCPTGAIYTICASSCQRTCFQPIVRPICLAGCVEGCEPSVGFVMQNGIPIPENECGCRYGDAYYQISQQWISKDCSQSCICEQNGQTNCHKVKCVEHAFCGSQNKVHGCHCESNYVGDGTERCNALCPLIMGNEITVRDLVDEGNHAVILSGYPILCEGYIRKFTIKRKNEAMEGVTFLIWRPSPVDPSKFIVVGSAQLTIDDDTMDLGTDANTKIPVKTGDFIGFMSHGGTVFFDDGAKLKDGSGFLTAPLFDDIEPLTEVTFQPGDGLRAYSVNVELESSNGKLVEPYMFSAYLGVQTKEIPDSAMTSSSALGEYKPHRGRLDNTDDKCTWTAERNNQEQWLQVDLSKEMLVIGVVTQGHCGKADDTEKEQLGCVRRFQVQTSNDGVTFQYIQDQNGNPENFDSKCEGHVHNKNFFRDATLVRYVRFVPTIWTYSISMRVDIIGRDDAEAEPKVDLTPRTLRADINAGILFINKPFTRKGFVTNIRYFALSSESFMIGVWRPTPSSTEYSLIGLSYITSTAQDQILTHQLTDKIPVHAGDVFGIFFEKQVIGCDEDQTAEVLIHTNIKLEEIKKVFFTGKLDFPNRVKRKCSIRVGFDVSKTKTIAPVMAVTTMGVQVGIVKDNQITSNGFCDSNGKANRVRLGLKDQQGLLGGWCGRQLDQTAHVQIDFMVKRRCGGVVTQGLNSVTRRWFVRKYVVMCSVDMTTWTDVADKNGNTIMFSGNFDQETDVKNYFPAVMICRAIRIRPMDWDGNFPAMRMDVLGLPDEITAEPEVGFTTVVRQSSGSGGFTLVIPEKKFISDGHVVGVRFRPTRTGSFKLMVFRPVNEADKKYQLVGKKRIRIKKRKVEVEVKFKEHKKLAVKEGDMIGLSFSKSVLYKSIDKDDVTDVVYARNRQIRRFTRLKPGKTVQFLAVTQRSYSVKALFEASGKGEVILSVDAKKPIGLENGQLGDDKISVSSTYAPDGNERPFRKDAARLNHVGMQEDLGGAWVPAPEDTKPWIQVDTGVESVMTGLITQGRHSKENWWVTTYNVKFSINCQDWLNVKDATGAIAVFEGNTDSDTQVQRFFLNAVNGQCLRVYPLTWHDRPALRMEVLGIFETAPTQYGMQLIDRAMLDNTNYIILLSGIPFESDGYITEWKFYPKTSFPFKAGVWRKDPVDPLRYKHIGSSDIPALTPNELATFQLDKTVRIPFRKGDVIGFSFTDSLIPFDEKEESIDILFSRNNGKLEPTPIGQYRRFQKADKMAYSIEADVQVQSGRDIPAVACRHGLGMDDDLIPDKSISSSSILNSQYTHSQARLNSQSSETLKGCWAPASNEKFQYVQADLGKPTFVTGVSIQGCHAEDRWVTKFQVELSRDGKNWNAARGTDGLKTFYGNTDSDTAVSVFFDQEDKVQYVRILVEEWSNEIGLRFDILGCPAVCEVEWGANPLVRKWKRTQCDKSFVVSIEHPLTCNGYITGWRFIPKYRESVTFFVLQPVDINKGLFTVVGKTLVPRKKWNRGEVVQIDLPKDKWIEVRSGNMIGFTSNGRSPIYVDKWSHDKSEVMVARTKRIRGFRGVSLGDTLEMTRSKKGKATYSFTAMLTQAAVGETKVMMPAVSCSAGIGLESGTIGDAAITVSSSMDFNMQGPAQARLKGDAAWIASVADKNVFVEVDIGYIGKVTGIATQGDPVNDNWVTSYSVEYTAVHDFTTKRPTKFVWVSETNTLKDVFAGNTDRDTIKVNYFKSQIPAQYVRVVVNDFHNQAAMRLDILGCNNPDPCSPNPCLNGGLCRKSQAIRGYTCKCQQEWGGKNCGFKANRCFGWGDPHYGNFDGQKFNFQGDCKYILSRTVAGTTKDPFEVSVDNVKSNRRSSVSVTREVYVKLDGKLFEFKKNREIFIDNERIRSPYEKEGVSIVDGSNKRVILKTESGLRVSWDGRSKVDVHLTEDYKTEVEGLCGNYNGKRGDDYIIRNTGEQTTNIKLFGESWGTDETCKGCVDCKEEDICREKNLVDEAQAACNVLINPHGPFAMCHDVITVQPFFDDCTLDFCALYPTMDNLCTDIETYADQCITRKIQVGTWRKPGFCSLPCPVGMAPSQIGTECPNTCGNPNAADECTGIVGPMCVCAEGMLLEDGDRCVPEIECGCTYQGVYHKKGETFLADDCTEICSCADDHTPACNPVDDCHEQAKCIVVDGVRGCHCNNGWTGDGIKVCDEILEPKEITVCYGGQLNIDCSADGERIEILVIDYGSYQSEACPETAGIVQPASMEQAKYVIRDRCHNHEKCSFSVDNVVFGSFYDEDAKSLYVKYQCRQSVSSSLTRKDTELIACEGETLNIDCGHLKIAVIRAMYGRNQGDYTCSPAGEQDTTLALNQDCIFRSAFRIASELCHTQGTCTINVQNALFGEDQCPGVKKYFKIEYQCMINPDPRVLEDDKCDPNPCVNGDCEAINIEPKYKCICKPGFTGNNCDIGKSTCKALGDPHYITFDGLYYDFMGHCKYTLVKNADANVHDFEVIVTNEKARRNPAMSSTVAVEFLYAGHVIELKNQGVTSLDGVTTNGYTSENLAIAIDSPNVVVTTNTGIVIRWDGRYLVEVDLTADFSDHVEGLCGNYNGDDTDEYVTRVGLTVDDPLKFGKSWFVAGPVACEDCEDCVLPEPCNDAAVKDKAQEVCGALISDTGAFQSCHATVSPDNAYKMCMTDMCTMPDGLAFCEDFQTYAEGCNDHGIIINWRRVDFCFIDCLAMDMVYSPKSPACPSSCANPIAALTCNLADRENCVCDIGMIKEGEKCVAIEQCGCLHKDSGFYFKQGESFITRDCLQVCLCKGAGDLECLSYSCIVNEYCGLKNGETACLCEEKYFRDAASNKCLEIPVPQVLVIPQWQDATIVCGTERYINVLDAHFGNPKQTDICLVVEGDQNCNAENSVAIVRQLCQGKELCGIPANVGTFGEPCFKSFKYLHTEFTCAHKKIPVEKLEILSLQVCLDQSLSLTCTHLPDAEIQLIEVFFGRHANDKFCLAENEAAPDAEQTLGGALEIAQPLCDGQKACTLKADTGSFGDPWVAGVEYLQVSYKCIVQPQ